MEQAPGYDMSLPRGIRNNNPGNIRISGTNWQGQISGPDSEFATFSAPVWGLRALARTLHTYRSRHGLTTIQGIISRWAPPSDNNNTGAYAQAVASRLGVPPNVPLIFSRSQVRELVAAIVHHENGMQPYDTALIDDAVRRAGWA